MLVSIRLENCGDLCGLLQFESDSDGGLLVHISSKTTISP